MWVLNTHRRSLASMADGGEITIAARQAAPYQLQYLQLGGDEIALLWNEEPASNATPPQAVLVSTDGLSDFLAWVATYYPYRPFTAFFRVTDPATAAIVLEEQPRVLDRWREPILGMVLADGLGGLTDTSSSEMAYHLSLSSCSFVLARAAWAGLLAKSQAVARAWVQAQQLTGAKRRTPLDIDRILWPWEALKELMSPERFQADSGLRLITDVLTQMTNGNEPSMWQLSPLMGSLGLAVDDIQELHARQVAREKRVVTIERVLSVLGSRKWEDASDERAAAFAAGFAASRIAPGTLEHLGLLDRISVTLPASRVWYGLMAGLHSQSKVFRFGAGFAYRLSRESFRREDFWSAPTSDLALPELQMLLGGGQNSATLLRRYSAQGRLSVELLPMVNTEVTLSSRGAPSLFEDGVGSNISRKLLHDLRRAMDDAEQLRRKLEVVLGSESESTDTYATPRKGRKKF